METVIVGMSGGVDSSVTALLLKEQGFNVIGLFMKNWEEEEGGPCQAVQDYEDVVSVCHHLQIPHYCLNFAQEYWDLVFSKCLHEYAAGATPNPDILCNREIKFTLLLKKALELGGDYLATGHYCQKEWIDGSWILKRGADPDKDQSYFLYTLKNTILDKVLFPIGGMLKKEVRIKAKQAGLATAEKKDSTGICFIGKRNFREFLAQYLPPKAGNFETLDGTVVGQHEGAHFYTIGQRRGLGLGGAGEAWYVLAKDMKRNVVTVERGEDHPDLFVHQITASTVSWVQRAPTFPLSCSAKIRYRSEDTPCTVVAAQEDQIAVTFGCPVKAATSRQSIVFYQGPLCLGGALID